MVRVAVFVPAVVLGVVRDPGFEREFLRQAARAAGVDPDDFANECEDRLSLGMELYQDAALGMPLRRLVRELDEEGADLGTWAVLAAQCDELQGLEGDVRLEVSLWLQEYAKLGARAVYVGGRIRDVLDG